MVYRHITVTKMTPNIGAYVSDVDLNAVSRSEVYDEIRRALWENKVIFFRDQNLTPEAHLKLAQTFGDVELHEFFPHLEGRPEIQVLASQGTKSPDTDRWHTDCTFRERPNHVCVLHGVDVPEIGGDTLWASTSAAFAALDENMRDLLLGLDAEHDISYAFRRMGYVAEARKLDQSNPPYIHPAVINHPITDELCLFVNSVWTKCFHNLSIRYSDHLMRMLNEWMMRPEFQVRFKWEKNSVAIWDNLATQHYAVYDYSGSQRRMHRATCNPSRVKLNARPNASRPAQIEAFAPPAMMAALRPEVPGNAGAGASHVADALIDEDRFDELAGAEKQAVQAILRALSELDVAKIVQTAAR